MAFGGGWVRGHSESGEEFDGEVGWFAVWDLSREDGDGMFCGFWWLVRWVVSVWRRLDSLKCWVQRFHAFDWV